MEKQTKKRFFLSHKKSSAILVSVIVHAAFIAIALTFVAVQVYIKPEQTFEVKDVQRPKMQLRKLQVPVKQQKKTQAPKLRKTIVTKQKTNIDIKMPEIVGIKGGSGFGSGGGLGGLGFGFDMDLFGGGSGTGNEFIGTLYDLKKTSDGQLTELGELVDEMLAKGEDLAGAEEPAIELIYNYMRAWSDRKLEGLFKAPKLKYATAFMMPFMSADEAPKAFSVEDEVKPSFWICVYRGQIAAPETGKYRFCGLGDDLLSVRIKGRLVLDGCWPNKRGRLSSWESEDPDNRRFKMDYGREAWYTRDSGMVIGDWFTLTKGERVDMEVLIGEFGGYAFTARLLVQQRGHTYKMVPCEDGQRPVLPIFKTAPINEKLIPMMHIDPNIATLDGPNFSVLENAPKKTNTF